MDALAPAAPRLSTYQRWLFFFLGVAGFFEGYDAFALTQILPSLRAEMSLSHSDEGLLVGFIGVGSILAYGLVRHADRWGRRRVMTITILGYTFFTLLTGLATGVVTFGLAQLLARIFLIAEWSIGMVYAAEEFPAERRGMVIGVLNAVTGLGAVICAGIAPLLVGSSLGWRGVYFIGAVPLLLMAIARRSLRETRRFSEQVAGTGAARRPFTRILDAPYRRPMLQLALIWALTYACSINAITFWKEHAVGERGISDVEAGMNVSIAAVAAMPLSFAAGKLIDRAGRRVGAMVLYAAMVLGIVGSYTLAPRPLLVLALVFGVAGVTSVPAVLSAYNAELFPTELRGDGFGWSNHLFGRFAAVVSPPMVGYAAGYLGWGRVIPLTTALPCVALVLVLWLLPETRGRELEETSVQAAH